MTRQSRSSLAIVYREAPSTAEGRWLLRFNSRWNAFSLIGGHEDPADAGDAWNCLRRELREELEPTTAGKAELETQKRVVRYEGFSQAAGEWSSYETTLIKVNFPEGLEPASSNPERPVVWASRAEIEAGRTTNAKPISSTVRWLLHHWGWNRSSALGGAASRSKVIFANRVARELSYESKSLLESDLEILFPNADQILVRALMQGFRNLSTERTILALDVKEPDQLFSVVAKLGTRREVWGDYEGWKLCLALRRTRSRILLEANGLELVSPEGLGCLAAGGNSCNPTDRVAVYYEDAFDLYAGDTEDGTPCSLEEAARKSLFDELPTTESVCRCIRQVSNEIRDRLYQSISANRSAARTYFEARMKRALPQLQQGGSLFPMRRRMNQFVATWFHRRNSPLWIDPLEYRDWSHDSTAPERLPECIVGLIHGDLHGRNILVGIHRHECEFPSVFDFGEVTAEGVVAWDFVKLEFEMKVRFLGELLSSEDVIREIERLSNERLEVLLPEFPPEGVTPLPSDAQHRKVLALMRLEYLLNEVSAEFEGMEGFRDFSSRIDSKNHALSRWLQIALTIRDECRESLQQLARERDGLHNGWLVDWNHAAVVYAIQSMKYSYSKPQREFAWAAGGIAAGWLVRHFNLVAEGTEIPFSESLRPHLLTLRKAEDKKGALAQALKQAEQFTASPAVERELALLYLDNNNTEAAEQLLRSSGREKEAREVRDYEWFSRIGRVYKSRIPNDGSPLRGAEFSLREAQHAYEQAWELSHHYYPGGNAAMIAAALGLANTKALATQVKESVEKLMRTKPFHPERHWAYATLGDMNVILGEEELAKNAYVQALRANKIPDESVRETITRQLKEFSRHPNFPKVGEMLEFLKGV